MKKRLLLVLDFDGFLINSYAIIRDTMQTYGLDVGDEERFKNRRKFLKYFGGGKELLSNLVGITLPKTPKTARCAHAVLSGIRPHLPRVEENPQYGDRESSHPLRNSKSQLHSGARAHDAARSAPQRG